MRIRNRSLQAPEVVAIDLRENIGSVGVRNVRKAFLSLVTLVVASQACGPLTVPEPTDVAAETSIAAPTTPTAHPTEPAPEPSPTAAEQVEEAPLSPLGPWWLFVTGETIFADGIWAVNANGSGLTQLVASDADQLIVRPRDLSTAISPTGGLLAFLTAGDQQFRDLRLNMLDLPTGELSVVTDLSSADTESASGSDPALRPPEPLLAIATEASLAWSPDGRYLAFMAAFEGPSSDLYVYSLENGSITRLTDGPSEGIRPSWSPDGRYIVHFGVTTLGSGAGYEMAGAWAAKADGSAVITLYQPDRTSGGEVLLGWTADDTFAVYTVDVSAGGNSDLRIINLETGEMHMLWEGLFRGAALDPNSGSILVLSDDFTAGESQEHARGVYLLSPGFSSPLRVLDDDPLSAEWSQAAGLFLARTEFGVVAVTTAGDWNQVHDFTGNLPIANPLEKELAWYGSEGMWIGNLISSIDDPQPEQVFGESISHAAWDPGGQRVMFFSDEGLYVVGKPDLNPILVVEGLSSRDSAWMLP